MRRRAGIFGALVLVAGSFAVIAGSGTADAAVVNDSPGFVAAWQDPNETFISLQNDVTLLAQPNRPNGAVSIVVVGNGFTLTAAPASRVLESTGAIGLVTLRDITITGGLPAAGDGGGARIVGDLRIEFSTIQGNTAPNNGGGVFSTDSLAIVGSTIDGNTANGLGGGVFSQGPIFINGSPLGDSSITGNTSSGDGGGVFGQGLASSLMVTDTTVSDNTSTGADGGGLYTEGALTVTDSTIGPDNEAASSSGGGTFSVGGTTVTGSTIQGNGANDGGGMVASQGATVSTSTVSGNLAGGTAGGGILVVGALTVTDSTVSGNQSLGNGGGIHGAGDITITRSTIGPDNTADIAGGGVYGQNSTADITVTDSTILGNGATAGGGIFNDGPTTITGSTLSGNQALGDGGGILADETLTATNSTFSGNTAGDSGGGVWAEGASFAYSDLVGNSAFSGANLFIFDSNDISTFGTVFANPLGGGDSCENIGTTNSSGYNYEAGSDTCGFGGGPGDVVNGADPQLGALAANGGPTQTLLPAQSSPLVDRIPAASPCGGVNIVVDQRGFARPVTAGLFCEIGAVELPIREPTFTG